ncbi:hypothetical protein B5S28_g2220 [[Candida] boidinii]|nr:hypothetical protein B5S28_g2220 [[Candida] boidinii]OWB62427.1 hypothetical protein B5S29_g3355 [[Candida] boidinii]OWB73903.1 hypothetical protein B5S31_g3670 [[Candida] boidinii]
MTELYTQPAKRLRTEEDLKLFIDSQTYKELTEFVVEIATSVHGLTLDEDDSKLNVSEHCIKILELLSQIDTIIDNHPVVNDTTSRFGKTEFRDFYDELDGKLDDLIREYIDLPNKDKNVTNNEVADHQTNDPTVELKSYLLNSWGDRVRIDYGSGHELNFTCFLLCLFKLKFLTIENDDKSTVLRIFAKYLKLMRKLQLKYWLEPAGSHGVWGLDDYHFLPFLFGAAQLSPLTRPRPLTIHNKDYVEEFKDKYFYYGCIDFINTVKTGAESLRWHSPMLDDISGVKTWKKIEEGMIKMYKAEVLNKLPVVQHFMFGNILPCPEGVTPVYSESETASGHVHGDHPHEHGSEDDSCCQDAVHSTYGDCCGIKVPSAIAASAMERKKNHNLIPFD